ncbi:MAG: ParB/RepB/Spo0J family partition protein [Syntrophomonadaceae bacterium]|nr:ParB/RepB/Spo0J family partition protein [Syntrophomonadaceae bacterium]MDD3888711.1 ParB/RepB/Spo0J family partition protein [Syntrophomonadaceae bacterium]MDD4548491.1 ParB/RepB/Spo0J family partition protein [Syntrophomonadaceae bacterium]
MPRKERGLGRGLDALLSGGLDIYDGNGLEVTQLAPDRVQPRNDQPRKNFDEASLQELAQSIKEHGMLQPLLVRLAGDSEDTYQIIAGERRWRAAQVAGLTEIPVIIKEIDDAEAAEISLIENLQRDDLSTVEEAMAYKNIMNSFGYTQEMLAERIGKSRAHIANTIRILSLPAEILQMVEQKQITAGHARAIIGAGSASELVQMAKAIANRGLSVRETEELVKAGKQGKTTTKRMPDKPPEINELEETLQKVLGTRAEIVRHKKGGKIEISYYSDDDLDRIMQLFGISIE